jgi:hypothetical protein
MTQELDFPTPSAPPERNSTDPDRTSARGTVEPCEFEELLERAMQILKARRASAGS